VSVKSVFRRQSRPRDRLRGEVRRGLHRRLRDAGRTSAYVPEHDRVEVPPRPDSGTADPTRRGAGRRGQELPQVQGVSVDFAAFRPVNQVSMRCRTGRSSRSSVRTPGKTTLSTVVSRLQRASEGASLLAGQDIHHRSRHGWQRTFQNLRIFENMDVLENVLVGCHRHENAGLMAGASACRPARERRLRIRRWTHCGSSAWRRGARAAASLPYGSSGWWRSPVRLPPSGSAADEPRRHERAGAEYLVDRIRRIRTPA